MKWKYRVALPHLLNQYDNKSIIVHLMFHQEIGGMYGMNLDFKWVGVVIICLRISAMKVILKDGMGRKIDALIFGKNRLFFLHFALFCLLSRAKCCFMKSCIE